MTAVPVTSRFQVTSAPTQAPGNCLTCRTTVGPFIDTGMRLDYYLEAPSERDGNVYLCVACVREMADNLNLASEDFQGKIDDARRAGVVEGVLLGKKMLDEFSVGFIDSSLSIGGALRPGQRLLITDDAEDTSFELTRPSAAVEVAGQGDDVSDEQGRLNLSGDSIDGEPLFPGLP